MLAINHALTGAVVGLIVGEPLLALPVAFASHFACDALPHFMPNMPVKKWLRSIAFQKLLITDALLCVTLVGVLAVARPEHWLLASFCAFTATSPDLFWINQFLVTRRGKKWKPNLFSKFGIWIQWFEKPIGGIVELAWVMAAISILTALIY